MRDKFTLLFCLMLTLGWTSVQAQIATETGGPALPKLNLPQRVKKAPVLGDINPSSLPDKTLSRAEAEAITYTWTDANGVSHTSTLAETATDPYQMIALCKAVYMDTRVPGPWYSAYDADGNREDPVDYTGDIAGGWDIPAGDYTPEQEGYTLLLVAVNDNATKDPSVLGFTYETSDGYYVAQYYKDAEGLAKFFAADVDSIVLLTDGLRMGSQENKTLGTMFNYSGTLNRFFFLGKGQARKRHEDVLEYEEYYGYPYGEYIPFKSLFEQFSPTGTTEGDETSDYYNELFNNGTAYSVIHDCRSVVMLGHYFSMNGLAGTDHYGLTNLQFYCPDYRLAYWTTEQSGDWGRTYTVDGRTVVPTEDVYGRRISSASSSSAYWSNYNQDYAPFTLLYTLALQAVVTDVRDTECTVDVTWTSSMDKIADNDIVENYTLYIVTTDENGDQVLIPIAMGEAGEIVTALQEYIYDVPRQENSYEITYVVSGSPVEGNYSTAWSNQATVIIPGLDTNERLRIVFDHYESDYDLVQEVNNYRNYMTINSDEGNTITYADLKSPTTVELYRQDTEGNTVLWATVELTASNGRLRYTVAYNNDYDGSLSVAPLQGVLNYSDEGDLLDLNGVLLADWFSASTAANNHPYEYSYQAVIAEGGLSNTDNEAYSNLYDVPVFKTNIALGGFYTQNEVDEVDKDRVLTVNVGNAEDWVQMGNRNEIWTYDLVRGVDSKPVNTDQTLEVYQRQADGSYMEQIGGEIHEFKSGTWFIDYFDTNDENMVESALLIDHDAYYVPIMTTFADGRLDGSLFNTYGCDIKFTGIGSVGIENVDIVQDDPSTGKTVDGVRYTTFTASVNMTASLPAVYEYDGNNVYEPYMYRVWVVGNNLLDSDNNKYAAGEYVWLGDYFTNSELSKRLEDLQFTSKAINTDTEAPDFKFLVRFYYKKKELSVAPVTNVINNAAYGLESDNMWYVVESALADPSNVSTGITELTTSTVADVTYYNAQGMRSSTPFDGVNIMVTRYSDGTTRVVKVVK